MTYKAKENYFEKDKLFGNEKVKLPVTIGKIYHFIYEPAKYFHGGWENARIYLYGDNGWVMIKLNDEQTILNFFNSFEPITK